MVQRSEGYTECPGLAGFLPTVAYQFRKYQRVVFRFLRVATGYLVLPVYAK